MNCKRELEVDLRGNEIPYRIRHHPRAITAQEIAATEPVPGRMFTKTVTTYGGEMCMMVLPAPYHVNPQKTAAVHGARDSVQGGV